MEEEKSIQISYAEAGTNTFSHTACLNIVGCPVWPVESRVGNDLQAMHGISTTRTLEGSMHARSPIKGQAGPARACASSSMGGVSFLVGYG